MPAAPNGWWLEVISSQRENGVLVVESWSWLSQKSRDNGDKPYIMHKAYMQVREQHMRMVVGVTGKPLWQPDKAQPPVEIADFAEFERTGQAVKYKAETVASKVQWEAQDGKRIAPFVFPTYYAVDEPLDPQFVRETFMLPEEGQMLENEYGFIARAEANGWSGDWRHSTLNLTVAASADDSRMNSGAWSATSANDSLGNNSTTPSAAVVEHQSRFTNVTIANGSTINTAVYTMQANGTFTHVDDTVNVTVGFEAADNPGQVANAGDFTGRTLTSTTVAWNAIGTWANSTDYAAPGVASSLQIVVNRGGFASGNAVNLFIRDNGSTAGATDLLGYRAALSYDASTSLCGRLAVDYTAPGGASVFTPFYYHQHIARMAA